MRWVTTQASKPKRNTSCTTALKKNSKTCGSAPFLMIILVILFHTALAWDKFLTTAGQSSSAAESTRPRYCKEVIISKGHP